MDFKLIAASVYLIPEKLRDWFLDIIEDFVQDKSTGVIETLGMKACEGIRLATNTEDFQDEVEQFEDVLSQVVEEAVDTGKHLPKIINVLEAIVLEEKNPISTEHVGGIFEPGYLKIK